MVFTYKDYKLYKIEVNFRGIGQRPMYFFSKKKPKRGILCDMPDGYEIFLNKKTGLPLLKYSKGKVSLYQRKKMLKQK